MRVLVVWEPVLETDWGRPSARQTGYLPDPRAIHYWDPSRRLSAMYGGAARLESLAGQTLTGFRMRDVVWDAALVYPPGTHWGSPAKLLVAPVVKYQSELAGSF